MQLFLIRHGQDLNPDQDRLTSADPALSKLGEEQANRCAIKLKAILKSNVAPVIIASPRIRTMQTATIVAAQLGEDPARVTLDGRLKERDCQTFSGMLAAEVFSRTEEDLVAGGMESYSKLVERLSAFYDDLSMHSDTPTIIVTHSGNIEPFMRLANTDYSDTLEADDFIRLIL